MIELNHMPKTVDDKEEVEKLVLQNGDLVDTADSNIVIQNQPCNHVINRECLKGFVAALLLFLLGLVAYSNKSFWNWRSSSNTKICIAHFNDMPKEWLVDASNEEELPMPLHAAQDPWSTKEQVEADMAVMSAVWEMLEFTSKLSKEDIIDLWWNTIEAYVDTAYATHEIMPEVELKSLKEASRILKIIWNETFEKSDNTTNKKDDPCQTALDIADWLPYTLVISSRLPHDDSLETTFQDEIHQFNAAMEACGMNDTTSIATFLQYDLGYDAFQAMANNTKHTKGNLWELIMWAITLVDMMRISNLDLPNDTDRFVAQVWDYCKQQDYSNFTNSFSSISYLVTHIGYVPTGYGRHELFVNDAEWLYRYIRENFFRALATEDMDLFSEFIDLLRSYGCTEETDAQLRYGTRYALSLYQDNAYQWNPATQKKENSHYSILHRPWTGLSALQRRVFEPSVPGSYGYTFQQAIKKWSQ